MDFIESEHWKKKTERRKTITSDVIEYAIKNSHELNDKHWQNALNAICRIPPSGRILKVVYRKEKHKIKIITAFWLD